MIHLPEMPVVYVTDPVLARYLLVLFYVGHFALLLLTLFLLHRLARFLHRVASAVYERLFAPQLRPRIEVIMPEGAIPPEQWSEAEQLRSLSRWYLLQRIREFMGAEER